MLVSLASAVEMDRFGGVQESLDRVRSTSWGQIVYSMVEVATEANGALQELTAAIDELIDDVEGHLAEVEHRFETFTNEFARDSNRLETQADDAQIELSQAQDLIDNVIEPGMALTRTAQERLTTLIAENRHAVQAEAVQRGQQHEAAQERITGHQQALSAVDECISALRGISNAPSLVQVKRLQNQVESIEAQVGRQEVLAPLVINIMELTSQQNFSDQSALRNVTPARNMLCFSSSPCSTISATPSSRNSTMRCSKRTRPRPSGRAASPNSTPSTSSSSASSTRRSTSLLATRVHFY